MKVHRKQHQKTKNRTCCLAVCLFSGLHLDSRWRAWVLALLLAGLAVAEEHEAVGLGGPEVKGDGPRLLGRPLAQSHKGLRGVKGHRVQRGHTLTLEGHHATDLGGGGTDRLVSHMQCPPPIPNFPTKNFCRWDKVGESKSGEAKLPRQPLKNINRIYSEVCGF